MGFVLGLGVGFDKDFFVNLLGCGLCGVTFYLPGYYGQISAAVGDTSRGWRIPSALFGALGILVAYALSLSLTRDRERRDRRGTCRHPAAFGEPAMSL